MDLDVDRESVAEAARRAAGYALTAVKYAALASIILALVLVVGAAGYLTLSDTVSMTAEPAYISEAAAAEHGFDRPSSDHDVIREDIPVGDPPTELELTVSLSETSKRSGGGNVDVLVASIPDAQLGPISANPLRYAPPSVVFNRLNDDVELDRVGSASAVVAGEDRSVVEYEANVATDDPRRDADADRGVYIGRFADDGDLLVVVVAYEADDEELIHEAFAILERLERPDERGPRS